MGAITTAVTIFEFAYIDAKKKNHADSFPSVEISETSINKKTSHREIDAIKKYFQLIGFKQYQLNDIYTGFF